MTVREFYIELHSDYEGTLRRLGNEDRMLRFLKKFAEDKTFETLKISLRERNYEDAFRFAHTLKGIALNLGLSALADRSSELTEALRKKVYREDLAKLFTLTAAEYEKTAETVRKLD